MPSLSSYITLLEDLAIVIRQGKEIECIQSRKEEMKTFLFVSGMVGYGEIPKKWEKQTNKKKLELRSKYEKVTE